MYVRNLKWCIDCYRTLSVTRVPVLSLDVTDQFGAGRRLFPLPVRLDRRPPVRHCTGKGQNDSGSSEHNKENLKNNEDVKELLSEIYEDFGVKKSDDQDATTNSREE